MPKIDLFLKEDYYIHYVHEHMFKKTPLVAVVKLKLRCHPSGTFQWTLGG